MIEMKGLDYYYQKRKPLFQNLDLTLKSGTICGLLGKNGAGKTTLLKLMAGLLFNKAGDVHIMHETPQKRTPQFLQNLYFLPDTFQLPAISMKQYVACYAPFYTQFNQEAYEKAVYEFELKTVKRLTDLSHGQQKKFLIAFGFATGAKLVLLDEPTNGLDIPSKQQFRQLLATHLDTDKTFIISTHQVKDIEHLIDSVVILDEGQIIFNQALDAIQDNTAHEYDSIDSTDLESLFNTVLNHQKK